MSSAGADGARRGPKPGHPGLRQCLATGTGTGINTASIERRNATCRGALSALTRHGHASAHAEGTLTAGVYLVGCPYYFC